MSTQMNLPLFGGRIQAAENRCGSDRKGRRSPSQRREAQRRSALKTSQELQAGGSLTALPGGRAGLAPKMKSRAFLILHWHLSPLPVSDLHHCALQFETPPISVLPSFSHGRTAKANIKFLLQ